MTGTGFAKNVKTCNSKQVLHVQDRGRCLSARSGLIHVNAHRSGKKHDVSTKRRSIWFLSALFGLWVTAARADMGLPMIAVSMRALIYAIIPIILIEGGIFKRGSDMSWSKALSASALANIASTLVGIPITWLLLVILEMLTGGGGAEFNTIFDKVLSVTLYAAWIYPFENWQIPAAQLALLVPFFFATWLVETSIVKTFFLQDFIIARRVCLRANLVTYALLAAITVGALVWTLTPDVSRQEFSALKAKYSNELEALPEMLSVVRSRPIPKNDGELVYSFDELLLAEIKGMADCGKFHELSYEVSTSAYRHRVGLLPGEGWVWVCGSGKSGVHASGMIRARQTEYGEFYLATGGYPPMTHYIFVLERDFEDVRYWVTAIFDSP